MVFEKKEKALYSLVQSVLSQSRMEMKGLKALNNTVNVNTYTVQSDAAFSSNFQLYQCHDVLKNFFFLIYCASRNCCHFAPIAIMANVSHTH